MDRRAEIEQRLSVVRLDIDQIWAILRNHDLSQKHRVELQAKLLTCEKARTELFSTLAILDDEPI
jgi:hypothetical protein